MDKQIFVFVTRIRMYLKLTKIKWYINGQMDFCLYNKNTQRNKFAFMLNQTELDYVQKI